MVTETTASINFLVLGLDGMKDAQCQQRQIKRHRFRRKSQWSRRSIEIVWWHGSSKKRAEMGIDAFFYVVESKSMNAISSFPSE